MDTAIYFFIFVLFVVSGFFQYKIIQLEKNLNEANKKRAKELSDTGKAITETLRTAFDNLKILNQKHERLNKNVKELEVRFHNLAAHDKRVIRQSIRTISKKEKDQNLKEQE